MSEPVQSKPVVNESSFVTLHYRIRLADSQQVVVSTFEDKPATLQMGAGQLAASTAARQLLSAYQVQS